MEEWFGLRQLARMAMGDPHLWLIEGLPGAGKTSFAERLASSCAVQGIEARWWIEEDRDHPVLPSTLRKMALQVDYDQRCLQAFAAFVARESGVLVLEGAAFQSTVRFMFANDRPTEAIREYVGAWAGVVRAANPRLLLFQVGDPFAHYDEAVRSLRGEGWLERLVSYVEGTPIARRRGWSGFGGFVEFWSAYQELCLRCAQDLPFPTKVVGAWSEKRYVDEGAALAFFCGRERPVDGSADALVARP